MPYSDYMYSMDDDSDGEDYAGQLSPSDGQFPPSSSNVTPLIPNVFIPDPTLQQRTERSAESKAREEGEDRFLTTRMTEGSAPPASCSSPSSTSRLAHARTLASALPPHHPHHRVTYSQSSSSQSSPRVLPGRARSPSVYSEAPPAYSPSAVSPVSPGSGNSSNSSATTTTTGQQGWLRNYNTFSTIHRMGAQGVEGERLLAFPPESMGGPVDEERAGPAWGRRVHRRLPAWFNWKYALLALVLLIISIAFLGGLSSLSSSKPSKGDDGAERPALPVDQEPIHQVPGDSDAPDDSELPNDPVSPGAPFVASYCEGEQHRYNDQILSLDFERSKNVTFRQTGYKQPGSMSVHIGGQINVRRLSEDDGNPRMVLEIMTNDPSLRLYTSLDGDLQEVRIRIPQSFDSTVPGQRPCVEVKGTVWVPEDAELGTLSIGATHLDILLFDDLSLQVADYTDLSSVIGDITAGVSRPASYGKDPDVPAARDVAAFSSRIIEVHTTAGAISGSWPLYDLLGLHTTSGNQRVTITPRPGGPEGEGEEKPAVLSLSTISGAISATEPVREPARLPRRDYLVDVRSTSGAVRASLAFGAGATFRTTASNVVLDLLPVIDVDKLTPQNPAQLETVTTSGAVAVRVLEPIFYGGGEGKAPAVGNATADGTGSPSSSSSRALDCLEARHKSTSGSIGIRYPQSWEGLLYAQTTSGQLVARGRDLKVTRFVGGWPGSKMEARKGGPGTKSTIEVHAILGGMDALIGDE
ncbi:hypothetical protein F4802DRAFT_599498 [Xylaria palmicola]|nr:hypothetical protein F4802DRAFT_599498 [Xylaria palmicola]